MVGAGVQIAAGAYSPLELLIALAVAVAVGGSIHNVPGARAAVTPAAGLARFPFPRFSVAAIAGSLVFYAWHVLLGYLVGPSATALLERYSAPLLVVLAGLAIVGLVGWLWMRRRAGSAARSWADAACPACLAITALRPR